MQGSLAVDYDMESSSEDICFVVHGSNAREEEFDSNVVLVPNELVIEKIRKAQ